MLTFLSPLFLIGLAAAAIPLLIHLSRSRRTKKMQFSTTRFFTDQFLRSYRMSRIKELWLLIARMALCALLAMALAKPMLLPKGRAPLLSQSRSVVLVIDDSASMGYTETGLAQLDRARSAGRQILDTLAEGDAASIVLASRRAGGPQVLFPQPTTQLADVRHALDDIQVSALGTDLTGALERASAMVQAGPGKNREIYVFSDLQDSGWEVREASTTNDADTVFFFVHTRPRNIQNLAVTALQYAAARPMVGVPFFIRPHVRNQSPTAVSCEVSLFVDGQKVSQQRIDNLESGRWGVARLHHTFDKGGWHSGYVEVSDSQLNIDNRRYFAFEVLDTVKVLAINGAPSAVTRLDELFFLRAALSSGASGRGSILMEAIVPAEVEKTDLTNYPAVIMANVESLSAAALERLEQYVDRGGSLFVFLGDRVNPDVYNRELAGTARLHGGLLPGRLTRLQGNPAGPEEFTYASSIGFDHPALAAFQDPAFANLTAVRFKSLWGLEPVEGALELMRAGSGDPLLLERPYGKGTVLLFASACDRDWSNFPVRAAWLPWVQRLIAYLAQEPMERQGFFVTGQNVPLPVSAAEGIRPVTVRKPDGGVGYAETTDDPANPLRFPDTSVPGVYTLHSTEAGVEGRLVVANLDSYESDLTYLDDVLTGAGKQGGRGRVEAGLRELMPGRPLISYIDTPENAVEDTSGARRGVRLWEGLLLIALALGLLEPWLANRISMRHYLRPRTTEGAASPSGIGLGVGLAGTAAGSNGGNGKQRVPASSGGLKAPERERELV